jgi:hypothetical protein
MLFELHLDFVFSISKPVYGYDFRFSLLIFPSDDDLQTLDLHFSSLIPNLPVWPIVHHKGRKSAPSDFLRMQSEVGLNPHGIWLDRKRWPQGGQMTSGQPFKMGIESDQRIRCASD